METIQKKNVIDIISEMYHNTRQLRSKLTVINLILDEGEEYTETEKRCLMSMSELLGEKIKVIEHSEQLFAKALKDLDIKKRSEDGRMGLTS